MVPKEYWRRFVQLHVGEVLSIYFQCALSQRGLRKFEEELNAALPGFEFAVLGVSLATRSFRPRGYIRGEIIRVR